MILAMVVSLIGMWVGVSNVFVLLYGCYFFGDTGGCVAGCNGCANVVFFVCLWVVWVFFVCTWGYWLVMAGWWMW